jgi:hypothetical protein
VSQHNWSNCRATGENSPVKDCVTVLLIVTAAEALNVMVAEMVTGSCEVVDVDIEVIVRVKFWIVCATVDVTVTEGAGQTA